MRYPRATWKPIPINFSRNGIRRPTLGLVLHVQGGNGELSGWFSNPKSQVSSHFWISKAGAVVQYVDTDDRAWAQAAGNPDYLSVETEGYPTEALTNAQITSLAALYAWGAKVFAWPNALAEIPGGRGLGWHGMGGTAWGNHPGCPGDKRKAQRKDVLFRAFPAPAPEPAPPAKEDEVKPYLTPYTDPGYVTAQWVVAPDLSHRVWVRDSASYKWLVETGQYAVTIVPASIMATVPALGDLPPRQ